MFTHVESARTVMVLLMVLAIGGSPVFAQPDLRHPNGHGPVENLRDGPGPGSRGTSSAPRRSNADTQAAQAAGAAAAQVVIGFLELLESMDKDCQDAKAALKASLSEADRINGGEALIDIMGCAAAKKMAREKLGWMPADERNQAENAEESDAEQGDTWAERQAKREQARREKRGREAIDDIFGSDRKETTSSKVPDLDRFNSQAGSDSGKDQLDRFDESRGDAGGRFASGGGKDLDRFDAGREEAAATEQASQWTSFPSRADNETGTGDRSDPLAGLKGLATNPADAAASGAGNKKSPPPETAERPTDSSAGRSTVAAVSNEGPAEEAGIDQYAEVYDKVDAVGSAVTGDPLDVITDQAGEAVESAFVEDVPEVAGPVGDEVEDVWKAATKAPADAAKAPTAVGRTEALSPMFKKEIDLFKAIGNYWRKLFGSSDETAPIATDNDAGDQKGGLLGEIKGHLNASHENP